MTAVNTHGLLIDDSLSLFRGKLARALQEEVASTKALLESLEKEYSALSELDEKLITINSAKKQTLIESLQRTSDLRIKLMAENGFPLSPTTVKNFTNSADSNSSLNDLFAHLSELAQLCLSKNRLIGQLINRKTRFVSQTLSSLSPSSVDQSLTYSKNGSAEKAHNLYASFST